MKIGDTVKVKLGNPFGSYIGQVHSHVKGKDGNPDCVWDIALPGIYGLSSTGNTTATHSRSGLVPFREGQLELV